MSSPFPEPEGPEPTDAQPIRHEDRLREAWLRGDWLDRLDARGPSVEDGGDGTEAWLERVRLHVRALSALPRLAAPAELDGAVVAALHAGHREDRAVRALECVLGRDARRSAPEELEARVRADVGHGAAGPTLAEGSAPPALDHLVARAIEAQQSRGAADSSRRPTSGAPGPHGGSLSSKGAPAGHGSIGTGRVVIVHRAASRMAGASLALVVFAGILVFGLRRADAPAGGIDEGAVSAQPTVGSEARSSDPAKNTSFVKVVPVDVDDLDPAERAMLESFGGPLFGGPS